MRKSFTNIKLWYLLTLNRQFLCRTLTLRAQSIQFYRSDKHNVLLEVENDALRFM